MGVLTALEPSRVFYYFEQICGIPHGSGHTKAISDFCVQFAREHHLQFRQDTLNNVVIRKPASPGYEDSPTVMLQGHMDMVTVKTEDCQKDMIREGLDLEVDGDWIYAKGTSLGGDDGIALAYAMAILEDDTLPHPPLEAVFTVDEEIGLLGAAFLDASDLKSRILMNMDSEEDGIFLISCAGGATAECRIPVERKEACGVPVSLVISGLVGGHSGTEINKGRANANLLLGRCLKKLEDKVSLQICSLEGGEKDNAISNYARAELLMDTDQIPIFQETVSDLEAVLKREYEIVEPDMKIRAVVPEGWSLDNGKDRKETTDVFSRDTAGKAISMLIHLPNGVQKRMAQMPDMIQTSLNLGVLHTGEQVTMTFSVRSSVSSEKEWLMEQLKDLSELHGGSCEFSGVYPAWEYREDSRVRPLMVEAYEKITGKAPLLEAIHAGVECGLFCEKLPGLDCISYGPQINEIHTTRERLSISSVKRTYELTTRVLEALH